MKQFPYIQKTTSTGIQYREYPEGLPDLTLDGLKWNKDYRLTNEEIDTLRLSEWVKYYFWLCSEVNKEIKAKMWIGGRKIV